MKIDDYKIRKNATVTDDGHTMRTTGGDVIDSMISGSHDINIEVDDRARNKSLGSGKSKKTMSTRRCFDNAKNFKKREMVNIGKVTIHGTTIDTSKASDGEFKNTKCVNLSTREIKDIIVSRNIRRLLALRSAS
ncbi:MAG TPA: hypothetical protein EYF95_05405 [Flavobacteriales bacterium]|jgi:hypothetical protein|nr:hypothetical protein [Flavobacteriales bacterium]